MNIRILLLTISCMLFFHSPTMAQHFDNIEMQAQLSSYKNINGVAVADYDQDYDLDIFLVVLQEQTSTGDNYLSKLLKNNGDGTFSDATEESGIKSVFDYSNEAQPLDVGFKMGASWGDFNNDSYPDIFLTSAYYNRLYVNNGNGTFSDITHEAGFDLTDECNNTGALWWDFNNDGYVDVFISKWQGCAYNRLYKNNGNETFTDVTAEMGIGGSIRTDATWMSIAIDVNEDGWLDIYTINDYHQPNELFINQEGNGFVEKASEYGLSLPTGEGMGAAIGDYNNDGKFDIYVTNVNESHHYVTKGDGTFSDKAQENKNTEAGWAWGTQFGDFDHDRDEDLVLVNGYGANTKNYFYKNTLIESGNGFLNFTDQAEINDPTNSKSMIAFDYDNDGDLDVLFSNEGAGIRFYENDAVERSKEGEQNWIKINLEGTTSNKDAIGAVLEINSQSGKQYRFRSGISLLAQSQQPEHIGLGNDQTVTSVIIKWPLGLEETYDNLPANKTYYVTEGAGYVTRDILAEKIEGCTDPKSCNYNPSATLNDGSCQYLNSRSITGKLVSGNLREEIYSYSGDVESSYSWEVENGEILSGQGTQVINVKWGIAEQGIIKVVEFNGCSSLPVEIQVRMLPSEISGNHSIARLWNEALLEAIRQDYARPTIHARNLFHTSIALYDSWAIYNETNTYFIGKELHNYTNNFNGFSTTVDQEEAVEMTMSYAAYRLLSHRFKNSPHAESTLNSFDELMNILSYDTNFTSQDYSMGDPGALGNFIAESIINYGLGDGAREISLYDNGHYQPVNTPLVPVSSANSNMQDPNRWQPLKLAVFIDQSGNVRSGTTPEFLNPEWGDVFPFSLKEDQVSNFQRDNNDYKVYLDPENPPKLDTVNLTVGSEAYKWGFSLVSVWGSHLDPTDGVMWDISPKSIGNIDISSISENIGDYPDFYKLLDGGDKGEGRAINPISNSAYEEQMVPRGDYARVLAEFWADGPDSETPPGHWFVLLNYVNDHPQFNKRMGGKGDELDPLEWDVKSYFIMGGAMHDAAISAWSVKGWYDYIRPISAIRYMAGRGQSTNSSLPSYDVGGIPLIDGFIELITEQDELARATNENVGKIKLNSWKGHDYVDNTEVDQAGVGWILAENWWPYQRPSFVTPPFAGYVSGHSTYSRAAAEVMTLLTGSEFFPGGMGAFVAKKNEFLVFEEGPSQDVVLQWATYRDASDQCSLSRIWGGIHPPADDLPGRRMGETIGVQAFSFAQPYFEQPVVNAAGNYEDSHLEVYPNPVSNLLRIKFERVIYNEYMVYDTFGKCVLKNNIALNQKEFDIDFNGFNRGIYVLIVKGNQAVKSVKVIKK